MPTTWIVTANASKALICSTTDNQSINVVDTLTHNESALKNQDLVTDSAGNHTSGTASQGHETSADPKQKEADRFAKIVANFIEKAQQAKNYDKLIIAASPQFLGELKADLSENIKDQISFIDKDFTKLPTEDLLEAIKKDVSL